MSSSTDAAVRPPSFSAIPVAAPLPGTCNRYRARGQNFVVEWLELGEGASQAFSGTKETFLILPKHAATLNWSTGQTELPGYSVTIIPPGEGSIAATRKATAILLRPAGEEDGDFINAAAYEVPDPRVAPAGAMQRRGTSAEPKVFPIAEIRPAEGRPRLKMLQSAEMSINWVEYEGPRDRTRLSPHSHDDFEQGSLAIMGEFVHHLRVAWGPDATLWRDDEHLAAPAPSLTIFPPGLIHTTEGVGSGRHMLIDVFCPARGDFRSRGWIANADDYEEATVAASPKAGTR